MVVGSTNHIVSPIEVPRNGTTPSPAPENVLMAKVSRRQWAGEQPRAHKRQGEPGPTSCGRACFLPGGSLSRPVGPCGREATLELYNSRNHLWNPSAALCGHTLTASQMLPVRCCVWKSKNTRAELGFLFSVWRLEESLPPKQALFGLLCLQWAVEPQLGTLLRRLRISSLICPAIFK